MPAVVTCECAYRYRNFVFDQILAGFKIEESTMKLFLNNGVGFWVIFKNEVVIDDKI